MKKFIAVLIVLTLVLCIWSKNPADVSLKQLPDDYSLEDGAVSSQSGAWIDHVVVYSDLVWK
ncbi:hypothetical protein [Anaerocolumna xylanovorans]|nr:hypothetical protein [Anaerocolumna xylanovorans]